MTTSEARLSRARLCSCPSSSPKRQLRERLSHSFRRLTWGDPDRHRLTVTFSDESEVDVGAQELDGCSEELSFVADPEDHSVCPAMRWSRLSGRVDRLGKRNARSKVLAHDDIVSGGWGGLSGLAVKLGCAWTSG